MIRMLAISCLLTFATSTIASSGIVINEIYYNPPDQIEDSGVNAEFLELFNSSEQTIDLSGMSFTGFDLVFSNGLQIQPGEYVVVAPNAQDIATTWGVTPIAQFTDGGLSGKGELLELIAADGSTVLDSVHYDDEAGWPGAPDGNGPSLELRNPALDNAVAQSWAASNDNTPTPAAQNSTYSSLTDPAIESHRLSPSVPDPHTHFEVIATIPGATSAELYYQIGTDGIEIGPLPMISTTDAATQSTQWSATIPGQSGGELVRYRITSGDLHSPELSDTINYHGLVIQDPTTNTQLPIFDFFISAEDYEGLYGTKFDNDRFPVVVAFDGQVIDNARIRVRGQTSRVQRKISYKVELPDGHTLDIGEFGHYPLDEFALQADRIDVPFVQTLFSWKTVFEQGEPELANFHIRLQRNGQFFGLYRFQGLYDGAWRDHNGYDDGELHKADKGGWRTLTKKRIYAFDKKSPKDDDRTAILAANDVFRRGQKEDQTAWAFRNVDLPAMVNYSALSALFHHADQLTKNYYVYLDGSTQRWSQLFWDLDINWRAGKFGSCPKYRMTEPTCIRNRLLDILWPIPEFQEMYWRRMRTIHDLYLQPGLLESWRINAISNISTEEGAQDAINWGGNNTLWKRNIVTDPYNRNIWEDSIENRRIAFAAEIRLPDATPPNPSVIINELQYNPGGGFEAEFIELYNPNSFAVDLSGWTVTGVDHTMRHGTVIPSLGYLVLTQSDVTFRNQYSGNIFVAGEYSGKLSNGGEQIDLVDSTGSLIDSVDYSDDLPWEMTADGTGYSLELRAPTLDNNQPSSWAISASIGGTPGAENGTLTELPNTPELNFSAVSLLEGNSGTQIHSLSASLTIAPQSTERFHWQLISDNATVGDPGNPDTDVIAAEGTLTFAANNQLAPFEIEIVGDTATEEDETFSIAFTSLDHAVVGNNIGAITIANDDFTSTPNALNVLVGNNVAQLPVIPFSNQDQGPGTASVLEDGNTLRLTGNVWKRVMLNYDLTTNTVLEFDFIGNQQGEYHAIGLELNNFGSSSLVYQLWGSKRYGHRDHLNYFGNDGNATHYKIAIGKKLRAKQYESMVFISNHDRGLQNAASSFANIHLYEESENTAN